MKLFTELKWAKFGQWRSAEMWPVESVVKNYQTTKSHQMTGKPNNISKFAIK